MIELMVALVLSGLLATVIFKFIQGENRVAELQHARGAVLQNARGTMELLSSELRTVAGGGIVSGGASEIEFRLPVAWGVYCQGTTTAQVLFAAGRVTGPVMVHDRAAGAWREGGTITAADAGTASDCSGLGDEIDRSGVAVLTVTGPAWAAAADEFYVFQTVRYYLQSTAAGETWIYRREGDGTPEPVAGPVLTGGSEPGLEFVYRSSTGAVAGASAAQEVEVTVRMRSRNEKLIDRSRPWTDEATAVVHLRNRI